MPHQVPARRQEMHDNRNMCDKPSIHGPAEIKEGILYHCLQSQKCTRSPETASFFSPEQSLNSRCRRKSAPCHRSLRLAGLRASVSKTERMERRFLMLMSLQGDYWQPQGVTNADDPSVAGFTARLWTRLWQHILTAAYQAAWNPAGTRQVTRKQLVGNSEGCLS